MMGNPHCTITALGLDTDQLQIADVALAARDSSSSSQVQPTCLLPPCGGLFSVPSLHNPRPALRSSNHLGNNWQRTLLHHCVVK